MNVLPETRTLEVLWEQGTYVTKFKNTQVKVEKDSNEFLKGNTDVDIMVEVGREKESMGIKDVFPFLSHASWNEIRMKSIRISQPSI